MEINFKPGNGRLLILVAALCLAGALAQTQLAPELSPAADQATAEAATRNYPEHKQSKPPSSKPVSATEPEKNGSQMTHLRKTGVPIPLTPEQMSAYLQRNNSSPESLLTVAHMSRNLPLLREIAARFPNDPAIQLELFHQETTQDSQRKAIENLRQAAPRNALADYLSALLHLQQGNTPAALRDLDLATHHSEFDDYYTDLLQGTEEAYLDCGFLPAEAKLSALLDGSARTTTSMLKLSRELSQLERTLTGSGDSAGLNLARQSALHLGRQMQNGPLLIDQFLGMRIEKSVLQTSARTPATTTRELELQKQKEELSKLASSTGNKDLTDSEIIGLVDRIKLYGEADAHRWLRQRSTPK